MKEISMKEIKPFQDFYADNLLNVGRDNQLLKYNVYLIKLQSFKLHTHLFNSLLKPVKPRKTEGKSSLHVRDKVYYAWNKHLLFKFFKARIVYFEVCIIIKL